MIGEVGGPRVAVMTFEVSRDGPSRDEAGLEGHREYWGLSRRGMAPLS